MRKLLNIVILRSPLHQAAYNDRSDGLVRSSAALKVKEQKMARQFPRGGISVLIVNRANCATAGARDIVAICRVSNY